MSIEIKIPTIGESINEVTLSQWLKADGDYVEMDENIAELESDKATFELPAERAGILRIIAQEGDTLEIGAVVASIEEGNAPSGASKETAGDTPVASRESDTGPGSSPDTNDRDSQDSSVTYASGTASPAAAKILREKGIDPATVKGTGKDGRITKEDAEKAQQSATPARSAA